MAKQGRHFEREIKLAVENLRQARARIRGAGFRVRKRRTLETNVLLDGEDGSLKAQGMLLRLRQYGSKTVLTLKGRPENGRHKVREETESEVANGQAVERIFLELGYQPVFRYEKYRTEFTDGKGIVTVDETPIGDYLELEGGARWIDRVARRLGYCERDYVTMSYGRLYLEYCYKNKIEPGNMVF